MPLAKIEDANARFRAAIRALTGIELPAQKIPMIEQRLRKRVMHWGHSSTESYMAALLAGEMDQAELALVVDLMTTNTTSFFREAEHFQILRDDLLPQLLRPVRGQRPRLKLWSAASSEGAEAYSLAMVLAEANRQGDRFDWAILGTDLSGRMIEKATSAIYAPDQLTGIPVDLARRYLMHASSGPMAGKLRIVPELRARVRFHQMNLMDEKYPVDPDVHVVFLRNILIYFDAPTKAAVIERVTRHLRPGGYLFVGHSESMVVRHPELAQIVPTVFQKVSE